MPALLCCIFTSPAHFQRWLSIIILKHRLPLFLSSPQVGNVMVQPAFPPTICQPANHQGQLNLKARWNSSERRDISRNARSGQVSWATRAACGGVWATAQLSSAQRSCQLWKWFVFIWFLTNTELESTTAKMGMDTNFCQQRKGGMVHKDKKKKTIQGGEKFKK